jgi:cytochrome c-type biogenesis protein CcmH/NrfG
MSGDGPSVFTCPTDQTLASFYAGELSAHEEDVVRDHLVDCAACIERARDAAAFAEAMKGVVQGKAGGRRFGGLPKWAAAVAAVFVATAFIFLWQTVQTPVDPAARWRDFTVDPAPNVSDDAHDMVWRGGEQPASETEGGSFAWAIAPYRTGDYSEARARLDRRVGNDPGDERARFYLALSCLKMGDEGRAVSLLREVASRPGDHAERARALLADIARRSKR